MPESEKLAGVINSLLVSQGNAFLGNFPGTEGGSDSTDWVTKALGQSGGFQLLTFKDVKEDRNSSSQFTER